MERNKWIAMVLAVALCFAAFPTGVYADDPAGTARVSDVSAFLAALANESVTDIIWEEGALEISNGVELTKNLTIENSGSLSLKEKGLLIVYSGVTLTLNGDAELRDDSELRIGGTLVNNARMQVGSAMTAVAPAAIVNNGTVIVNDDPKLGFGWISLFDIISDGGDGPDNVTVSAISLSGNPLGGESSEVSRIADVNGPHSIAYAMGNSAYTDIWLSIFHDTGDPPVGIAVMVSGNLTVTKTMEVMENDELTVTGNVEIASGGQLYVSGKLTVQGNLTNNDKLFIGGTLDIAGAATNYGYYIRAAQATLNKEIEDVSDGDHMRGYYVKNQADWAAALADKAHCNPIIVGKEAVGDDAIVISEDTEITSNLIAEGVLAIAEGKTLTVNVRYDHDYNGIMNDVSGEINNAGMLKLYVPMSISGEGKITNEETGCIEGGEIDARFGLSEGNVHPLVNKGLIRRCDVRMDYTHLAWRDIDNTGDGWYENPGYDFRHELSASRGDERYGMLGLWDYDDTNGWYFTAVPANQLELLPGSGIALVMLDSEELSKNPGQSIVNGDSFVRISALEWGDFEVSYTAEKSSLNERLYRMGVTSDIPSMGFYSDAAASRENYLSEFTYEPGKEDSFYAVVSDGLSDQWTSSYEVTDGKGRIRIDGTDSATAYKVTVEPETTDDFDIEVKIVMTDASTSESREYRRRMTLREAETEGLVVHWANWRDLGGFHYPVLDQEPKHYERSIQSSKGRYTLAFFYKYWDAVNGVWNYTPVAPDDLIISEESQITASRWTHERIADIPSGDRGYHDYIFTEIDVPKLGNWKAGYKPGSATFEIPLQIALPTIGAYTDPAGGEANWLPEILYNEVRRVYFVPTVDLSEADLLKSEIRIGGVSEALDYNQATETFSSDGYVSLQAHRTDGKIDYFTADFARLPFLEGFDLEVIIRNLEENEIARSNTYCRSQLPQAPMTDRGVLNAPTDPGAAYDTSVEWTGATSVPQETVCYAAFTPGTLSGGGYVFTLAGNSTGARLYLFDENWLLLEQSEYEDLSADGRTASIWTTDLTPGKKYYLAAHNESDATCTMSLSAGYREAPKAPALAVKHGEQGTLGFEVSGGEAGQNYNLYVKVDGTWQNRRSEPCRDDESLFVHAFDVLENGESASEFAAAIEQDGIPGMKKEVSADIARSDTETAGMHATWMDTPGNNKIYIRSNDDGAVFAAGSYLRFYHEDGEGRWDFNGSIFGDGRSIAGGDGSAGEDGISEMGRWVLVGYTETKSGDAYTVGWKTYIDTGKALGSLEEGTFDVLECIVNTSERKVDARIDLRTIVPDTTPSGISCIFALYDSDGRMVDLRFRQDVALEAGRISFSEPLTYPAGSSLGFCKVFVLKQGDWSPVTQVFEQYLGEYTEIKGIVSAGLDVRKGSVVIGYEFHGPDGIITYEKACSDDYALDVAASTVTLLKDGVQIGNAVRLDQLNIESDVTEQESGSVLFSDFASLLTTFGLAFDTSNPMNPANLASIPTHVRVAIRPKTFVGGKAVSNPWTPITVTEAVYSDLYMDTGIAPEHCSIGAPAGNRTTGIPFELSLEIKKTGGVAIPNGSYAILAYDGSEATPVGGHAETYVSNGQATISVLLTEPGSHELAVRVNNTKIGTVTISVFGPPILQRMESGEGFTTMELTFDKAMADPTGKHGAFTVYGADHAAIAVTAIALKSGDAKTLVLTLASPVIGVSESGFKYEGESITAADGTLLLPMIPAWMAP